MNNYLVKEPSSTVSAQFLKSRTTAKALVDAAEREAAAIIQAAKREADEIVDFAKSTAAKEQEKQETRSRLSTLLAWRHAVAIAKDDLISLTERFASCILIDEVSNSPASILKRIESASELIEDQVGLTLEISQAEAEAIWVKESLEKSNSNFSLSFSTDLNPGEFVLKSKRCQIRSSPHYHLKMLMREFFDSTPTYRLSARKILTDELESF